MKARRSVRLAVLLAAVTTAISAVGARASVVYDWVCDDPGCDGDAAFAATLTLSDVAFLAGDFTGVAGNIEAWTTTSGVGAGFTLGLGDILTGADGSVVDDADNVRMVLSADRSEVSDLFDVTVGTNISFIGPDRIQPRVDYFEGAGGGYTVGALRDAAGVTSNIVIEGRFVRRVVAEPLPVLLFASGLVLLVHARGRRERALAARRGPGRDRRAEGEGWRDCASDAASAASVRAPPASSAPGPARSSDCRSAA